VLQPREAQTSAAKRLQLAVCPVHLVARNGRHEVRELVPEPHDQAAQRLALGVGRRLFAVKSGTGQDPGLVEQDLVWPTRHVAEMTGAADGQLTFGTAGQDEKFSVIIVEVLEEDCFAETTDERRPARLEVVVCGVAGDQSKIDIRMHISRAAGMRATDERGHYALVSVARPGEPFHD